MKLSVNARDLYLHILQAVKHVFLFLLEQMHKQQFNVGIKLSLENYVWAMVGF